MPNKQQVQYFSIFLTNPNSGFTDQLLHFSAFYKLGLSLGYKYIHTPLKSRRSSSKVYEFLGFNDCFLIKINKILWFQYKFIDIEFNDEILQISGVQTVLELQEFVKKTILERSDSFNCNKKIVIRFKLVPGVARRIFRLIHSCIQDFSDGLSLRSVYFSKNGNIRRSKFLSDKIKILVHIRQGDTAAIETPWQTFIPLRGENRLVELKQKPSSIQIKGRSYSIFDIEDYYDFIKKLTSYFGEDRFSSIISSDGYHRAFETIYKNIERLNLSPGQVKSLKRAAVHYDSKKFALFEDIKDSISIIGENDENLYDLIHSSLTADIIIMGTQQTMIPKLLANYYDIKKRPIILSLYKTKEPPNYESEFSLTAEKATVIHHKLDEYNFDDLAIQLEKEITNRSPKFCQPR